MIALKSGLLFLVMLDAPVSFTGKTAFHKAMMRAIPYLPQSATFLISEIKGDKPAVTFSNKRKSWQLRSALGSNAEVTLRSREELTMPTKEQVVALESVLNLPLKFEENFPIRIEPSEDRDTYTYVVFYKDRMDRSMKMIEVSKATGEITITMPH